MGVNRTLCLCVGSGATLEVGRHASTHRPVSPVSNVSFVTPLCLALFGVGFLSGCQEEGVVEVAWNMVDRLGEPVYPGGVLSTDRRPDSCDLPGFSIADPVGYRLQMELESCDASGACASNLFSCAVHRGAITIAPQDDPYEFTLRAIARRNDREEDCPPLDPACIATPGPRQRKVKDGLVTDLQVYQIVIDMEENGSSQASRLDLEACGCG